MPLHIIDFLTIRPCGVPPACGVVGRIEQLYQGRLNVCLWLPYTVDFLETKRLFITTEGINLRCRNESYMPAVTMTPIRTKRPRTDTGLAVVIAHQLQRECPRAAVIGLALEFVACGVVNGMSVHIAPHCYQLGNRYHDFLA